MESKPVQLIPGCYVGVKEPMIPAFEGARRSAGDTEVVSGLKENYGNLAAGTRARHAKEAGHSA